MLLTARLIVLVRVGSDGLLLPSANDASLDEDNTKPPLGVNC